MSIVKHWLTEADNKTWDMAKAMGLYAFVHFHVLSAWNVFHSSLPFLPSEYGTGLGALFATLGVLLGLKKETPP